jgi:sulfoacetaldehyde dehydrogenase
MNDSSANTYISAMIERARKAQSIAAQYTQEAIDRMTAIIAYEMTREVVKDELATLALEETQLGDYNSKIGKIDSKVKGVFYEIKKRKTVGIIDEFPELGLRKIYKPVGVIGALIPSTQPEMIPITTALFCMKSRNAVIYSPHPRGKKTTNHVTDMLRKLLIKNNVPEDLIQCIEPDMLSLEATNKLMRGSDLIMATGGAGMVHAAYSSGKPAYGVGAGNAAMCIDNTADLKDAAKKIRMSKTADLAAGCSCDNSLVIFEDVYDEAISALKAEGAFLCTPEEKQKIQKAIFPDWPKNHNINRNIVAKPVKIIGELAGLQFPEGTKFILVEETGSGVDYPLSGEKMCLVITVYRCKNIDEAIARVNANHAYSGAGHSCGIYSNNDENIVKFSLNTKTVRVNNNLPNSLTNTGAWFAGYPFSPSLGCGTWGGNICSKNVGLDEYMNTTWIATEIDRKVPTDEELFGDIDVMQK